MRSKLVLGLLMAGLAVVLVACGGPAPSGPVEVQVSLQEFSISSSLTTFQVGTTYHFVITNNGVLAHEWIIASRGVTDEGQFLIKIEEEAIPPGATVEQDFTFTAAGDFELACHVPEPDHYAAGMVLPFTVQ